MGTDPRRYGGTFAFREEQTLMSNPMMMLPKRDRHGPGGHGTSMAWGPWQFTQGELLEVGAVVAPGVRVGMASAHPIDKEIDLG